MVTYSFWVKVLRSLRSAPAQKDLSTALARTRALVCPSLVATARGVSLPSGVYCLWRSSSSARSAAISEREIALRAEGRLSSSTRIWPDPEAGVFVTRMRGPGSAAVEYRRRRIGKRREEMRRGGIVAVRLQVMARNCDEEGESETVPGPCPGNVYQYRVVARRNVRVCMRMWSLLAGNGICGI